MPARLQVLVVLGLLVAGGLLAVSDGTYSPDLQRVAVFTGPLAGDGLARMIKVLAIMIVFFALLLVAMLLVFERGIGRLSRLRRR